MLADVRHLRPTHPDLTFWIEVRLREFDGQWLAVADLAAEPDVGNGTRAAGGASRGSDGARSAAREGAGDCAYLGDGGRVGTCVSTVMHMPPCRIPGVCSRERRTL
jgi:hypothetical protein